MSSKEYQHPEQLTIPDRLVAGGSERWEVLDVFSARATRRGGFPFPRTVKIDVALIMPKQSQGRFEMVLARIHKTEIRTTSAESIILHNRGDEHDQFILSGTGFDGIYLFSHDVGEQQATQEVKNQGHARKIDHLEGVLRQYRDTLTEQPGYFPAWQQAARNLAPAVAQFYLLDPER